MFDDRQRFHDVVSQQVTYFECGGFSVGISCSLLLADPLAFSSFLKRLETIHGDLFANENSSAAPLSALFYLHSPIKYPPSPYGINPSPKPSKTVVFKLQGSTTRSQYGPLALLCVKEVQAEAGCQMGLKLSVLVKDGYEATEVESVAKSEAIENYLGKGCMKHASWDDFGASNVMFQFRTLKEVPVSASHWIGSPDGFVMVVASGSGEDHVVYVFVIY